VSRQNVELVRRAVVAVIRRPKPDFDTVNALYHPDHEYVSRLETLEGGSRRGASGYRDWLLNAEETFEWESRLERVTEIDDERVLAITPTRIRGKQSGVRLDEERIGCLVTVREGRIVRTELYPSPEEALEAARLPEDRRRELLDRTT
jgi:ketosteroid isomerase-like protein